MVAQYFLFGQIYFEIWTNTFGSLDKYTHGSIFCKVEGGGSYMQGWGDKPMLEWLHNTDDDDDDDDDDYNVDDGDDGDETYY